MEMCTDEDKSDWKGCPMSEIYRCFDPWILEHVPEVSPSERHSVLYKLPHRCDNVPPTPWKNMPRWDASHVRMPCSPRNQYPVQKSDGTTCLEDRWELICNALNRPINSTYDLEAAIFSYNTKYAKIWKFTALHSLFEKELEEEECMSFFRYTLPGIINLALQLPTLVPGAIPLLKKDTEQSISMSQQQVACLLANAFLCTFPRRNTQKKNSEYSAFPDINFNRLFESTGQRVIEKIKCICNYLRRVCVKAPTGCITFMRRSMSADDLPQWETCKAPLSATPMHVSSTGTIEDQGRGLLQVDFANKFIGGGVLGSGCVQEEIRFVICPELLITRLFTECLRPLEAMVVIGTEQFNQYTGYASTFAWAGNHTDDTPYDSSRRRQCNIVAIDALNFVQPCHQYRSQMIFRELNKAYVGFRHPFPTPAPGIASGNWGCGAFGGNSFFKALLQLITCCVTKRPLAYFTFGDKQLRNDIGKMYAVLCEQEVTVAQLLKILLNYKNNEEQELNDFIFHSLDQISSESIPTSSRVATTLPAFENIENITNAESTRTPSPAHTLLDSLDKYMHDSTPEPKGISVTVTSGCSGSSLPLVSSCTELESQSLSAIKYDDLLDEYIPASPESAAAPQARQSRKHTIDSYFSKRQY